MTETFVKSFTHLKDRPRAEQALLMLKRVASLVKPLMRKHGWVLPVLSEFFPDNPSLQGLNVNGGEKILLRLRPAWAPDSFLEEEHVMGTMLHELTHNLHGPHDDKFYKFLSSLETEYEELKRSGYEGEGFFSKGQRLGTNVSHDLPPHLARLKALEAAEKRRKVASVMDGSRRLGGRSSSGMSPRELALQAAERRARDDRACGSGMEAQRETDKAARESVETSIIDLTDLSDDEGLSTGSSRIVTAQPKISTTPKTIESDNRVASQQNSTRAVDRLRTKQRSPEKLPASRSPQKQFPRAVSLPDSGWTCQTCTLINKSTAPQCVVCLSPKLEEGWSCSVCGEDGMPHNFWTCRFCGTVKSHS